MQAILFFKADNLSDTMLAEYQELCSAAGLQKAYRVKDSPLLAGRVDPAALPGLLALPFVAAVDVSVALDDVTPHSHMTRDDWQRSYALRAKGAGQALTQAESKELVALLEKEALEFAYKFSAYTAAHWAGIDQTQRALMRRLVEAEAGYRAKKNKLAAAERAKRAAKQPKKRGRKPQKGKVK